MMTAAARVARRAKSDDGEEQETDEIKQRARRSHQQTRRIAVHHALRCGNQQIDTDPAAESGSEGVKRFTRDKKSRTSGAPVPSPFPPVASAENS